MDGSLSAPTWTLDLLTFSELPQVADIEAIVFPEPLDLQSLMRLWFADETCYLTYRAGDRVATYFGFQVFGPTAHVISNATHPDFRRQGLGAMILKEAEAVAAVQGARWFLGEVRKSNTPQRELLEKIGWVETGLSERFFGNGEDAYVVWRGFSPADAS